MLELDINLSSDRSALVVDHFNYDTLSAPQQHDVLVVPRPAPLRDDVKPLFSGDGVLAFPRTAGQALGNKSPLVAPIVRAPITAYSYDSKDKEQGMDESFASSTQISLVSAMQARNSARFTVVGSAESLQDKWFSAKVKTAAGGKETKTANRDFAKQVTSWTFKETGVVKVGQVKHYLKEDAVDGSAPSNESGKLNPQIYRIKTDAVCTMRTNYLKYLSRT